MATDEINNIVIKTNTAIDECIRKLLKETNALYWKFLLVKENRAKAHPEKD